MRYNLACTIIRQIGDFDEALSAGPFFERINSATLIRHLEADPDFDSIREDPTFKEMLGAAKKRLGMQGDAGLAPPSALDSSGGR